MIEIRRADDRYLTEGVGTSTRHSFSYGAHYDPANIGFGALRAINVETVAPGAGYEAHHHSDVEIVTWVLEGALRHTDTAGGGGVIRPGTAQRLSAGDGAQHAEVNDSATEPLVFVQVMLASEREGAPEYASVEVPSDTGRLLPTVAVHAPAELAVARLAPGDHVTVPAAGRVFVTVTRGSVRLGDQELATGDEARLIDAGEVDLVATEPAEALVWLLA